MKKTGELPGNVFVFGEGALRENLFREFAETPFFEDCSGFTPAEIADKIELLGTSEESDWSEETPPAAPYKGGNKIYFFGWQSQTTIRSVLQVSHFALMPSRFLETFGLSALESLSEGVPVIGFQKGGLMPFIPKELAVPFLASDTENTEALANTIVEVSDKFIPPLLQKERGLGGEAT